MSDESTTTRTSTGTSIPSRPIRWGIIGAGRIADTFAQDLTLLPDAELVAVGSRRPGGADEFATKFAVPHRHASYEELAVDPDVDVVYVATPHPMHVDDSLLAIGAGKAVLCEKPFTVNAGEAERVVRAARERGTFLMEAMWTRFLPHMVQLRAWLAEGVLGDVQAVYADHGQLFPVETESRGYAPELAGGALLDLGVYPISLAAMVLGRPSAVTAVSEPAMTGVDLQTSMLFRHSGGAQAVLTCTMAANSPVRAAVVGTRARVEIDSVWYRPTTMRLIDKDRVLRTYDEPVAGRGMQFEAAEVGRCLRAGRLESDVLSLEESISIMETMDEVRRQIGLRYPFE
jgi:predicted dehydrogenase